MLADELMSWNEHEEEKDDQTPTDTLERNENDTLEREQAESSTPVLYGESIYNIEEESTYQAQVEAG